VTKKETVDLVQMIKDEEMKKARTVIEPSDTFDKYSVDEDWETKGGKQLLDDKLLVVERRFVA